VTATVRSLASRRVHPGGLLSLAVLGVALVGTAAEPAPPPRAVAPNRPEVAASGIHGAAPSSTSRLGIGRVTPFARPRGAAFVSALYPDAGPTARGVTPAVRPATMTDGYELIVFAPHRPIRAQVKLLYQGKPIADRWTVALRKAFDGFDRDRDGTLNGFEVQYIFTDASLTQLMRTGNYLPNPSNLPTLARLDTDGDHRVSFPEFAAYYRLSADRAVQAFPPFAENPANAQATEALFKLFDGNGDGKLTKAEVDAAEHLLATRDADEDECLSLEELTQPGGPRNRFVPVPVVTGTTPRQPTVPQNIVVYEAGRVPGTVVQRVIKEYDKDNDFELTRAESGLDAGTFARLDADGNGRLTGAELDVWRTGPADLNVTLSLAPMPDECMVEVTTDPKELAARGFTARRVEGRRAVVHHGRQPIEFWAYASVVRNARSALKQQWTALFQQASGGRGFITEEMIGGANAPQFQLVRVIFDPADFNADGKLTRAEFDRYLDLQQAFVDLGIGLTPAVQTPTLFQLLDENRDGRLGVRELRTAWKRLVVLEPAGAGGGTAEVVTRAAIQPAVSVRVSRSLDRFNAVNQQIDFDNANRAPVPQKGPGWFRKMDRNGDGDVSRLEFLGTRAEFDAMDADRDDLISLQEAEAFEKKTRTAEK
jgi:Ca2+-binding EF-hand superfamily protein